MLVRELMSKKLVTVDADISMMKASRLMKDNGIQHLLVLKKGRLAGIVSDRDLKEAQRSKGTALDIYELYYLLDNITVGSVMPRQLFTIDPGATVGKAAAVMLKHNISALPVVNPDGGLEGIITKGDIFRAFVSISGIHLGDLAMGFEIEDRPGAIKEVTDVIRAHGGRLASILTGYEWAPPGFRHLYIRARKIKDEKALQQELGSKVKILYFIHEKVK
jgi:acetoin utilization protein AcuB